MAAAKIMLETAEMKGKEAMEKVDEIRKKQKLLDKSTHKLLDQALSSKVLPQGKRKAESDEKLSKKKKSN